ncbi:MAG: trans-aconitate 2-methyltransferase [Candidatus Babeliales bacterium]
MKRIKSFALASCSLLAASEWDGKLYHQNSSIQFQKGSAIINNWPFKGSENILDIGCGNGALTGEIAKKTTGSVLGTDASGSMIAFAQHHYIQENLSFATIDATTLNFNQEFDLAFSFNCLHWIKDKQKVFDAVFKALKPGGKFVFLFSIKPPDRNYKLITLATELKSNEYWKQYFPENHQWPWYHEKQETIENMLTQSNFNIIELKSCYNGVPIENKENIIQHLLALSWLDPLSQEKQEQFVRELIDSYLSEISGLENPHHYEAYQIYAVVTKP